MLENIKSTDALPKLQRDVMLILNTAKYFQVHTLVATSIAAACGFGVGNVIHNSSGEERDDFLRWSSCEARKDQKNPCSTDELKTISAMQNKQEKMADFGAGLSIALGFGAAAIRYRRKGGKWEIPRIKSFSPPAKQP